MKRKSTLILIAALVLAVSIPLFAFAETALGTQPEDGTGFMNGRGNGMGVDEDIVDANGNQYSLSNGYSVDADGTCYYLDENGEVQHLFSRSADGECTALQIGNGSARWADDDEAGTVAATNMNRRTSDESESFGGMGRGRWN